jgi:5,10-methylenetetrahydromethanopterin reductase
VWFAENPFNRGVFPAVTGAVLATKRLKVGIGVFNPYNRHPTLIAMEIGALDELAEGRALLGLGSGIGDRITRMGLSYEKPLAAVRDAVTIVRGMMKGETVTYSGAVFSVSNVKMEYEPPRPNMPIYMAAMGDQALRLCGQIADGLMISNMCPPGYTERAVTVLQEGADKVGRPRPKEIVQYVLCAVGKDRAEARAAARKTIAEMLIPYWAMGARWPAVREAMYRNSGIEEDEFIKAIERLQAGEDPQTVLDDRFVDAYALAGTVEDCIKSAARFGAVNVTELVVTIVGKTPMESMSLLGPALRGNS